MTRVARSAIVDYQTYEEERPAFRAVVMAEKARRRVHVGDRLTLLFENTLTVRYQVQEMMRAERIVREADIRHELETYNGLLGGEGELGATLLVEIEDRDQRGQWLRQHLGLPERIYLETADGGRAFAVPDAGQSDGDKLSAVQYLRFPLGGEPPVAAGVDDPRLGLRVDLTDDQRRALAEDLAG